MPNINKSVLNSNLNFIQLKLFDFSDEKIDQEKSKIRSDTIKKPNIPLLTMET